MTSAVGFLTGRTRWLMFVLIFAVAVYLLAVTPIRTYFHQRAEMAVATQRYNTLASANKALNEQAAELQNDATISALARQRYELVPSGTQAYAVMPPATETTQAANPAPEPSPSNWQKVRDAITFWN